MGFIRFNLDPKLLQNITNLGYAEPTPIQAEAIPEALKGRDIRGCAQTGTGKTCAFLVPIIEHLLRGKPAQKPAVLVISPTRELAAQIIEVAHGLIKGTSIRTVLILGGMSSHQQVKELRHNPEIIVATPGRLLDHVENNKVSLRHVKYLVLDEADRMLDMGFLPDVKRILSTLPQWRQTMLFSATFDARVIQLTNELLKQPAVINVSPSTTATSANVTQIAYPVRQDQKRALLQALLELGKMTSVLIFTRTKHGANKLAQTLRDQGRSVALIHSNRSQSQRQEALKGFKSRKYQILVATDIAARGIDVKDISHVVNYDVPRHSEDYVHRIGRTGRAQAMGEAITLVAPDEEQSLRDIERFIRKPIPRGVIPDFPYSKQPKVFPQQPSHSRPHEPHRSEPRHENRPHAEHRPPREPRHDKPFRTTHGRRHDRPHGDNRPRHQGQGFQRRDDNRPRHQGQNFQRRDDNRPFRDQRPQGQHGQQRHDNRPHRQDFRSNDRPQNDRPRSHEQRPQGQSGWLRPARPHGDNRPQGGRPHDQRSHGFQGNRSHGHPGPRHENRSPNRQEGGSSSQHNPERPQRPSHPEDWWKHRPSNKQGYRKKWNNRDRH